MLCIGDIHINARMKDRIIQSLQDYVSSHPEEKHIIFMGDYVYHFAYDRGSLLALYEFFVSLYMQGKFVYILAGNHDRLGEHFVFAEAQRAFDLLPEQEDRGLYFITEPRYFSIEGENVLFVPYMLHIEPVDVAVLRGARSNNYVSIIDNIQHLSVSRHDRERVSATSTAAILQAYQQYNDLLVIHHCYVHNTRFPGQKARFTYKDVALDPQLLDLPNLRLLSGHLHQAFVYKNYCCLGSIWYTSPLERDQIKYLGRYVDKTLYMDSVLINPYVSLDEHYTSVDMSTLAYRWEQIWQEHASLLQGDRDVRLSALLVPTWQDVSMVRHTQQFDYQQIEQSVDADVLRTVQSFALKRPQLAIQDLLEGFDASARNLQTGFADRKLIIQEYIAKKYPDDAEHYMQVLREMKIV